MVNVARVRDHFRAYDGTKTCLLATYKKKLSKLAEGDRKKDPEWEKASVRVA